MGKAKIFLFQAMKKRNPHDISDMTSPDEKISTVSSYRRSLRAEERSTVSPEAKFEDVGKNKEKLFYEFGQPAFRQDLRKQIEVRSFIFAMCFKVMKIQSAKHRL